LEKAVSSTNRFGKVRLGGGVRSLLYYAEYTEYAEFARARLYKSTPQHGRSILYPAILDGAHGLTTWRYRNDANCVVVISACDSIHFRREVFYKTVYSNEVYYMNLSTIY
jgi:hypothetical protein